MPTTTPKGWPVPLMGDPPDGPGGFLALATAIDNQLPRAVAYGQVIVTTNASGDFSVTLTPTLPAAPTLVLMTPADPAAVCRYIVTAIGSLWTATTIQGRAFNGSNVAIVSASVRLNYLAMV